MSKYHPDIEPRHIHFVLPEPPIKFWHSQSDIKTYHFNALAVFLPTLERLVVLSLKKAIHSEITPELKSQVVSLVAQEAIHGREFNVYNQSAVLAHFKLNVKDYKMRLFRGLFGLFNKLIPTFHYAVSAAGEHLTAISADLFLQEPQWFEGMSPEYSAIWRWHCIEEIEHKTVAYDVFQSLNGNYLLRVFGMIMMTWVFCIMHIKPIWQMMKKDSQHKKYRFYVDLFKYYWGKEGLYRKLFKPYFDYFKPRFHPSLHQNGFLIASWKAFFKQANKHEIAKALQNVQPDYCLKNSFKKEEA